MNKGGALVNQLIAETEEEKKFLELGKGIHVFMILQKLSNSDLSCIFFLLVIDRKTGYSKSTRVGFTN